MPRGSEFPESGELVVCTVADVKNFGAFVWLDEYPTEKGREKLALRAKVTEKADEIPFASGDFREGFIHITEVAPGWIKYIRDYVREGQKAVCKVLKVDEAKGHVHLSLKAVNEHQKREKVQQFKNEQKADKLMEFVAAKIGATVDACWDDFGYALVDKFGSLYGAVATGVGDGRRTTRPRRRRWRRPPRGSLSTSRRMAARASSSGRSESGRANDHASVSRGPDVHAAGRVPEVRRADDPAAPGPVLAGGPVRRLPSEAEATGRHVMDNIQIHYDEHPKLDDPTFVQGLPGIGNVGKLAAEHLKDELKAGKFAEIYSKDFPPQVLVLDDGQIRLVQNEMYYVKRGKGKDLVILVGDYQGLTPDGQYELADFVLKELKKLGVLRVFTLGGYGMRGMVAEPRVPGAGT